MAVILAGGVGDRSFKQYIEITRKEDLDLFERYMLPQEKR